MMLLYFAIIEFKKVKNKTLITVIIPEVLPSAPVRELSDETATG